MVKMPRYDSGAFSLPLKANRGATETLAMERSRNKKINKRKSSSNRLKILRLRSE
jgi:hypothetical protein